MGLGGARLSPDPGEGKDGFSREPGRQRELPFHTAEQMKAFLCPGVSSRIIPGPGVPGLEFAVGFAQNEGRDLGMPGEIPSAKAGLCLMIPWMWEQGPAAALGSHHSQRIPVGLGPIHGCSGPCAPPAQGNFAILLLAPPWHSLEVTVTFESRFLNLLIISCAGNWRPLINASAWNGPGIQPQIPSFLQHPLTEAL